MALIETPYYNITENSNNKNKKTWTSFQSFMSRMYTSHLIIKITRTIEVVLLPLMIVLTESSSNNSTLQEV
jgi:uncharacterized ion transporter superfamily protein YfcC